MRAENILQSCPTNLARRFYDDIDLLVLGNPS